MEVLNKNQRLEAAKIAADYCGWSVKFGPFDYQIEFLGETTYELGAAAHDPGEFLWFSSPKPKEYPHIFIALNHPAQKLFPPGTFLFSTNENVSKKDLKVIKHPQDAVGALEVSGALWDGNFERHFQEQTEELHEEWSSDYFKPIASDLTRNDVTKFLEILFWNQKQINIPSHLEEIWPSNKKECPYPNSIEFILKLSPILWDAGLLPGCEFGQPAEDLIYIINDWAETQSIKLQINDSMFEEIHDTDEVLLELDQHLEEQGYRLIVMMPDGEARNFTLIRNQDFTNFDLISHKLGQIFFPAAEIFNIIGAP